MKILKGKVISNKMNKTAIVLINKTIKHPFYNKYILKSKKIYVHDEFNLCNIGDFLEIFLVKPISKKKFWRILKFLF